MNQVVQVEEGQQLLRIKKIKQIRIWNLEKIVVLYIYITYIYIYKAETDK